jgi:hypothetical protein
MPHANSPAAAISTKKRLRREIPISKFIMNPYLLAN